MKTQEFLRQIPELLRSQLPPELQDFHTLGPMGSLIKFHYGDSHIHYEVWVQRRIKQVEVGLHFESNAATNSMYLEGMSRHLADIHSVLGSTVEPEQWTPSWTRVHQTLPLEALEEDFLMEVTSRMSRLVRVLEPVVRMETNMVLSKAPGS
jgi:hypothetical protein